MKPSNFLVVAALTAFSCSEKESKQASPSSGAKAGESASFSGTRRVLGPLSVEIPKNWEESKPTSKMRLAQFKLSGAGSDAEDGELVVFYFGSGQGGGVEANLERWYGQIQTADGRPAKEAAKKQSWQQDGLKISFIDVAGTYVAQMSPNSDEKSDNPGWRLLGAVVETEQGPVFFKAIGPGATLARVLETRKEMLRTIRPAV